MKVRALPNPQDTTIDWYSFAPSCMLPPPNRRAFCHMQAGLAGMLGMAGSANVQGEDQKKLDVLANDVFISLLTV